MEARTLRITHAVSLQCPLSELYEYWQDGAHLNSILRHLQTHLDRTPAKSNSSSGARALAVSHAPLPVLEIVNRAPNSLVEWLARSGAGVLYRGQVSFRPAPVGRGTEVRLTVDITERRSAFERLRDKLKRSDPKLLVYEDLRNFKQLLETGEFPTTRGQAHGLRSARGRKLVELVEKRLQREPVEGPLLPAPTTFTQGVSS